eukprot:6215102-Amphidinium_carterae.1
MTPDFARQNDVNDASARERQVHTSVQFRARPARLLDGTRSRTGSGVLSVRHCRFIRRTECVEHIRNNGRLTPTSAFRCLLHLQIPLLLVVVWSALAKGVLVVINCILVLLVSELYA